MDNFLRTSNSNRYIIDDDFIPKVTSDGEPHELMTLVAGVSGLIAAVIILIVLVILLGCKQNDKKSIKHKQDIKSIPPLSGNIEKEKCGTLIPMFIRQENPNVKQTELTLISIIPNQNFGCTNYGYEINSNDNCKTGITLNVSEITTGRF